MLRLTRGGQLCGREAGRRHAGRRTGNTIRGTIRPELGGDGVDNTSLALWLRQLLPAHPALLIVFNGDTADRTTDRLKEAHRERTPHLQNQLRQGLPDVCAEGRAQAIRVPRLTRSFAG